MTRAAAALALLLVGAATAVAGLALHEKNWPLFLLCLAAPLATAYAAPPGWLRLGYVTGWFLVLAVAVLGRPEGDFALSTSVRGYALLLNGLLLLGFMVATIPRPVRPPA